MASAPPPPVWTDRQAAASVPSGQEARPAGFWIRVVAFLIDWLIVGIPTLAVFITLAIMFSGDGKYDPGFVIAVCILAALAVIAGCWLYEALLTSSPRSASLGKQALGLRIVHEDGSRLGFGRATGRYFARALITPNIPLGIGFLMAAGTERKRALHDFIASTVVVRNR